MNGPTDSNDGGGDGCYVPSDLYYPGNDALTPGGVSFTGGGDAALSTLGSALHIDSSGDPYTRAKSRQYEPSGFDAANSGGGGDVDGGSF